MPSAQGRWRSRNDSKSAFDFDSAALVVGARGAHEISFGFQNFPRDSGTPIFQRFCLARCSGVLSQRVMDLVSRDQCSNGHGADYSRGSHALSFDDFVVFIYDGQHRAPKHTHLSDRFVARR